MRRLLRLVVLVSAVVPFAAQARDTGFIDRKIAINGTISKYVVYLPET